MKVHRHLAGAVLGTSILAGCATTTANNTAADQSVPVTKEGTCLSDTGSRARPSDTRCAVYGRAYSAEDIQRTGKTNVGDALAQLDPSITVSH